MCVCVCVHYAYTYPCIYLLICVYKIYTHTNSRALSLPLSLTHTHTHTYIYIYIYIYIWMSDYQRYLVTVSFLPIDHQDKCLIWWFIFTKPSTRAGYDTRSIFKRSLTGLNSVFSFSWTSCLTKAEEPSLPNYLPLAGGRIIGFIPFPLVLVLYEMQLVSARIWTRIGRRVLFLRR